jgi:DNA-binding LytR/AlgR family response regulator
VTKAIIAEDEAPQRAELRSMLAMLWPELQIVAECEDGLEAMEVLEAHQPEIVFLDIRMPGVSGLEVAKAANGRAQIVFTTAYDEYALQAFEHGAIDYLLKPIKRERLEVAIARARERLRQTPPDVSTVIAALEQRLTKRSGGDEIQWITASIGNTTKMIAIGDVLFFQAQDKYTRVVTAKEEALIRMTLRELTERLNDKLFWQVHRSTVVQVSAIESVLRDEFGKLTLRIKGSKESVPVSSAFNYRFKAM